MHAVLHAVFDTLAVMKALLQCNIDTARISSSTAALHLITPGKVGESHFMVCLAL
jgi:hypothetical protein